MCSRIFRGFIHYKQSSELNIFLVFLGSHYLRVEKESYRQIIDSYIVHDFLFQKAHFDQINVDTKSLDWNQQQIGMFCFLSIYQQQHCRDLFLVATDEYSRRAVNKPYFEFNIHAFLRYLIYLDSAAVLFQ